MSLSFFVQTFSISETKHVMKKLHDNTWTVTLENLINKPIKNMLLFPFKEFSLSFITCFLL